MPANNRTERGFTLIEMLIIAPIAVLIIAGFIGLMISMTGDVLTSQQRATQVYDATTALDRIEQDVNHAGLLASSVPAASLTSPQGSNNAAAPWSASAGDSTLILKEYATNANPINVNSYRDLIYTDSPNACYGDDMIYNKPYLVYVVYFLKKPSGSSTGTLWRRTILPPGASTCDTPWQRNSCAPGSTLNDTPCTTNDEAILDHVSSATFTYYLNASDSGTTTNIDAALSVNSSLTTSESIAGHPSDYTTSLRSTRLNNAN